VRLSGIADPTAVTLAIARQSLELIFDELIENARKFHPSQQPALEIIAEQAGDTLRIDVCDNGVSLSPEQLARAQQPYFQGERYFTGQTAGMGLGLAVVAALMWRVGGTSQIYNCQPGPGVGVELRVPIAAAGR
jgi:two-component system cell cycle response regulator